MTTTHYRALASCQAELCAKPNISLFPTTQRSTPIFLDETGLTKINNLHIASRNQS